MGTDRDWEKWGLVDPYFGVCSFERFHTGCMSEEDRVAFFSSGEAHIKGVLQRITENFGDAFIPQSALDFGCGVGRLLIPLARQVNRAAGVDVSQSMLAEAKRNCLITNIQNVDLFESDDNLSHVTGTFDLVHSHIVLQHIPWRRGRAILRTLATRVAPGGYLAVQVLTNYRGSQIVRGLAKLRYALPPANWLRNLLKKRPIFQPAMQMHVYDLDAVLSDLESGGFHCHYDEMNYQGFTSTFIYARRAAQS